MTLGKNRYFVHLDSQAPSHPVLSDSYRETGRFFEFFNNVEGVRETVAIFSIHHVVAILKQHK